jgi:hypothetical protein
MAMTNPHKLSECADMTEEKFQECFERVDMKVFMENPTQALTDAGITLKKGVILKFVETEEAANALPAGVFPLVRTKKNNEELTLDDLDKAVGGWRVSDLTNYNKSQLGSYGHKS